MSVSTQQEEGATPLTVVSDKNHNFHKRVSQHQPGIVTYGMTPPKVGTESARLPTLAETQGQRIRSLPVDAVIMYDIHDEKDRTPNMPRPFPFAATLDGLQWAERMGDVDVPFVHFRCIAKHEPEDMEKQFVESQEHRASRAVVIVGGSASSQALPLTMDEAYAMKQRVAPDVLLGAVAIPERHATKGNEHERMFQKQTIGGVNFFVTQCVYNLEEAKNLLSDYASLCRKSQTEMVPILVTLAPCGSVKTLEFLRWLGVKVPRWLENDLVSAASEGGDILEESVEALLHLFKDLLIFAKKKRIPLGCNVESVAIRKAEIDASIRLVSEIRKLLSESESSAEITAPNNIAAAPIA